MSLYSFICVVMNGVLPHLLEFAVRNRNSLFHNASMRFVSVSFAVQGSMDDWFLHGIIPFCIQLKSANKKSRLYSFLNSCEKPIKSALKLCIYFFYKIVGKSAQSHCNRSELFWKALRRFLKPPDLPVRILPVVECHLRFDLRKNRATSIKNTDKSVFSAVSSFLVHQYVMVYLK